MALHDVIFQEIFTCYVVPLSALLVVVALIKDYIRCVYVKFKSSLSTRISDVYERATCKHKQRLFAQLLQLSEKVDRPLKMLELNVGFGDNFKYYPGGCDVVCLDPDAAYEEYIQNRAGEDYPQIRLLDFIVGGGEILCGLPDSCLDAVIITHGLHKDPDPTKTVKEIFRILKKEGHFYVLDHTEAPKWSFAGILQLLVTPVYLALRIPCSFRRDIAEILRSCPFEYIDNKVFQLDTSELSILDRVVMPVWWRVHIASAATK